MEKVNILYLYLQRKLLEAANELYAKKGFLYEEQRWEEIESRKKNGKLVSEMHFSVARQHLNEHYNIPLKLCTPILYELKNLELAEIEGKQQHMKIRLINIHKGRLIDKTNKIYQICL